MHLLQSRHLNSLAKYPNRAALVVTAPDKAMEEAGDNYDGIDTPDTFDSQLVH